MQIIESSNFGVRAAIHTLKSPRSNIEFLLLPMIHIADKSFFISINTALNQCDKFIFEGIKSYHIKFITASYSLLKFRPDLGLSLQKDIVKPLTFGDKAIHADYNSKSFQSNWQNLTLKQKLQLLFIAPLYGIYRFFTCSRQSLFDSCGTDDLKSRESVLRFEDDKQIEEFIMDQRDKHIFDAIDSLFELNPQETVGILYGAAHMSGIISYLRSKYQYRTYHSEWLWVMQP